jgi:hypothetical protein
MAKKGKYDAVDFEEIEAAAPVAHPEPLPEAASVAAPLVVLSNTEPVIEPPRPSYALSVVPLVPTNTKEELDVIRRVWGATIMGDAPKLNAIIQTRQVMSEETGRMLKSALAIGRSLVDLRTTLTRDEFARGLRRSGEIFRGWSSGNISKVMKVAEFVDSYHLEVAAIPQSYSTIYELTTLSEEDFSRAQEMSLLRPDVRRSDIIEFKKGIEGLASAEDMKSKELAAVEKEINDARALLAKLRRNKTNILKRLRKGTK